MDGKTEIAEAKTVAAAAARKKLAARFGIESEFVRVPLLSKVIGLSTVAIYEAMREGRFFLPHRMLLSSPAVKFDDLVKWYCDDSTFQQGASVEESLEVEEEARKAKSLQPRDMEAGHEVCALQKVDAAGRRAKMDIINLAMSKMRKV